ncbi:MAG: CapA family protein [Candidatus Helarchaeota archaeon]
MGIQDKNQAGKTYKWAVDTPRKRFSTPYNLIEGLQWILHNVIRPSRKFWKLTKFIPQKVVLNKISPQIKLGFVGDIMRTEGKKLTFAPEVIAFFKDVDFLIGNFEGTITRKETKIFAAQVHSKNILASLEKLFPPERFVLTFANNHAGDFGWSEFNKSYQMVKEYGFKTMGRRDEPSILLNNQVNIVNCTAWSNQPDTPYIAYLRDSNAYLNPRSKFNILYPHWGYEMQLYPNPKQIKLAKTLLKRWDMIIGHHSHCPQPITAYEVERETKLVAYSPGDFCISIRYKKYFWGIVVKVELGPADGKWKVGSVEWKFTKVYEIDKNTLEIRLKKRCKYF